MYIFFAIHCVWCWLFDFFVAIQQLIKGAGITIEKYPEIHGFALGSTSGNKYTGEKTFEALTKFISDLLVADNKDDKKDAPKSEL